MSANARKLKITDEDSGSEVSNVLDKQEILIWRRETPSETENRLQIAAADAKCERIMRIATLMFVLAVHLIVTLVGVAIFVFASSPAKLNGAALILAALLTSPLLPKHLSRR